MKTIVAIVLYCLSTSVAFAAISFPTLPPDVIPKPKKCDYGWFAFLNQSLDKWDAIDEAMFVESGDADCRAGEGHRELLCQVLDGLSSTNNDGRLCGTYTIMCPSGYTYNVDCRERI